MKGPSKKYLPLLLGLACAFGVILGAKLNFSDYSGGLLSANKKKEKLTRLIDYIEYEYVDEVNTDSIVDVTVNGILKNLDPHSVYIPEEEYAMLSENMQGDFVGIGVSFYNVNDTIAVIQALEGGPSERVGIQGGDRILYANGTPLFNQNISSDSLTTHLKGEENSSVVLKVLRKGEPELLEFNVRRGKVPLKSVDAAYMLSENLGYIKINRFAETTHEEFRKSLKELKKQGATQLALDLRDNPGGYLSEATAIADEFLKEDKLILMTKNKSGSVEKTFATDDGMFENGRIFVLLNENSASASEIVAGALQDNDKGTIVGRRSYGKGLVQREMALGDGSAVRLTIARYYTPTGRSIQKPYDQGNKIYFNDYINRYKHGELVHEDSIEVDDSLKYTTPGGKTVYGGGGIIPDVFIPKDTNLEKETLTLLLRRGFFDRFIFEVLESNREFYQTLSLEQLKQLALDNKIVKELEAYALNRKNLYPHPEFRLEIDTYLPVLKQYLKASMARQLFGTDAFEQIVNQGDPAIEKLLQLSK